MIKVTLLHSNKCHKQNLEVNSYMLHFSDLLEDDGKCPPPKVPDGLQWERTTVYLPFTSSSSESGAKGVCHTHKSLLSWIYSPENAANHYLDQVRSEGGL